MSPEKYQQKFQKRTAIVEENDRRWTATEKRGTTKQSETLWTVNK